MWIFDKLFNRKIEGKSSLDSLEQFVPESEKLKSLLDKVEFEGDKVKLNADFQVEGLTSKGIANTGGLANIGNVAVSGNVESTGTIDGYLKDGITMTPIEGVEVRYYISKVIGNVCFVQFKFFNNTGSAIATSMKIADVSYTPSSTITFIGFYSNATATLRINDQAELRTANQIANGTEFGGFIMIGLTNPQP